MKAAIRTRRVNGVFELTLDRPKANAIDLGTSRKMGEAFLRFRDDDTLRVAIVRTAGEKFFPAAGNLKAAAGGEAVDGDYGVGGFAAYKNCGGSTNRLLRRWKVWRSVVVLNWRWRPI